MDKYLSGIRIKSLRQSRKMSQEELGKLLGVGKSTIGKYEKGIVENLKKETISKMANIFDVSPLYILGIEDESIKNELVEVLDKLTPEQQKALLQFAKAMVK